MPENLAYCLVLHSDSIDESDCNRAFKRIFGGFTAPFWRPVMSAMSEWHAFSQGQKSL